MEPQETAYSEEQMALIQKKIGLLGPINSSANWFLFIALLSMANSLIFFLGGSISFLLGLGITQLVDAFVYVCTQELTGDWDTVVRLVGFVLDIIFAWIFIGAGLLAKKQFRWAFPIGMALYAADGLLLVLFQDWFAVAFHAFALYIIWRGFQSINTLRNLEKNGVIDVPAGMIPKTKPLIRISKKTSTIITLVCVVLLVCLFSWLLIGIPLLSGGQ